MSKRLTRCQHLKTETRLDYTFQAVYSHVLAWEELQRLSPHAIYLKLLQLYPSCIHREFDDLRSDCCSGERLSPWQRGYNRIYILSERIVPYASLSSC